MPIIKPISELRNYPDVLKEERIRFLNTNPGLQSRFSRYIEFPDYSADELFENNLGTQRKENHEH